MSTQHDKFESWGLFIFGSLLLVMSFPGLVRYMLTGDTYFHGYRNVPFDLFGGEAFLMLMAHFLIGAYLFWLGARRLIGKA